MQTFDQFLEAKKDFFDYSDVAKELWGDKLRDEMKRTNIRFDLENDSHVAERVITVDQNFWDFTTCRFRCQLYSAGGDWQQPVLYFRVQLAEGYAKDLRRRQCFCVIPDKEHGNPHLVQGKHGLVAPNHNDTKKDGPKQDERAAWKFLKEHLNKLVEEEIQKVKSHQ